MKAGTKIKVNKILFRSFIALIVAGALFFVGTIAVSISLKLRWNSFLVDFAAAVSSSRTEEGSLLRAERPDGDIRVGGSNIQSVYNLLTNGKAKSFLKPKTESGRIILHFGDGSVMTVYETSDDGVYVTLKSENSNYSFALGAAAKYSDILLITSESSRNEGNVPWVEE